MPSLAVPALLRTGIAFPHRHPHEWNHVRPLAERLRHHMTPAGKSPRVAVLAASTHPVSGAWNVQVFHGLGDKAYTLNPRFLQRGHAVRLRTALNIAASSVGLRGRFLDPPRAVRPRRGRYDQYNAYGPRWVDLLALRVRDADVTRFGHVALNERDGLRGDLDGPIVWMPTWDNRHTMGGAGGSSLEWMGPAVLEAARSGTRFLVKFHPLTVSRNQSARLRRELAATPGIDVAPADANPYDLLEGARGLLTDTSSLGFEAYCCGVSVGLAVPDGVRLGGLHAELADRAHRVDPESLRDWMDHPTPGADRAWSEDLLYPPSSSLNDAFAADLRRRAEVE